MTLPVGSIVASILTLDDFKRQMPKSEVWELADGNKLGPNALAKIIAGGGEYSELNPGNVPTKPNLMGVFLRGRDYETIPQKLRNPDGKVKLGTYQADEFKSHHHSYGGPNGDNGNRAGQQDAWYQHREYSTGDSGGAETRPRNVTVNFFVRVN